MPELPEVETTKTSLLPLIDQKVLHVQVRESRLRWPIPEDIQQLQGQKLVRLTRRSKYILAELKPIACYGIWVCRVVLESVMNMKRLESMTI